MSRYIPTETTDKTNKIISNLTLTAEKNSPLKKVKSATTIIRMIDESEIIPATFLPMRDFCDIKIKLFGKWARRLPFNFP